MADRELIRDIIKEYQNSEEIALMRLNIELLSKLLKGNGQIGLCEKVRNIERSIKPLWAMVGVLGTAILAAITKFLIWG
jgi:hypothetical protein